MMTRSGLLAAFLWLSVISSAFAQDAPKEIIFKVSHADIAVLGKALDALPFAEAADTIVKLQDQLGAQHEIRIG
jgi:hypothetical protein